MNELTRDVLQVLTEHPRAAPFLAGGGILSLPSIDDWPETNKTPAVVLIDPGGHTHTHLSSLVRDTRYTLEVWVVSRDMSERDDVQITTVVEDPIADLVQVVVDILDMNRIRAKYASAYLTGESKPTPFHDGSPQLLGKALIFEYRRIKSP